MDISLVIPMFNEKDSVHELISEAEASLKGVNVEQVIGKKVSYEIIIVDDGSTDGLDTILSQEAVKRKALKIISFNRNYGKAAALQAGFVECKGKYVITMDGDLQDNPKEIGRFISALGKFDVVSGWKKKRHDPLSKKIPSKLFNYVTGILSGIPIHDFNCGLKGYRYDVVKSMNIYGQMHRFLPVIAKKNGFTVSEIVVDHRSRKHGKTKYGASRFFYGFFDLLTVLFISKYMKRPMHFFGAGGLLCLFLGISIGTYLTFIKVVFNEGISQRPLMLLSVLLTILGVQFFSLGLISEIIIKSSDTNPPYIIKKS